MSQYVLQLVVNPSVFCKFTGHCLQSNHILVVKWEDYAQSLIALLRPEVTAISILGLGVIH